MKAVSVHWSSAIDALNSSWIVGIATATTVVGIDVAAFESAIAASVCQRAAIARDGTARIGRRQLASC